MRDSKNYRLALNTRLKEAKRYIEEMEQADALDGDRYWRTVNNLTGYLQQTANQLRETAMEGTLLNEMEQEIGNEL